HCDPRGGIMRVRTPVIDFSEVRPDWAPNHEFAHYYNAASTVPAHVEPFLVKVLAYSEGFEAMGSSSAEVFFTELDDYLEGADESAAALWKWHLAEEFEHRSVCYDVYKPLYGHGLRSYLYRLYGFVYAVAHIGSHVKRVNAYLLGQDRRNLSETEQASSVERQQQVKRRIARASLPRLLKVFSPFYDPACKRAPLGMAQYLDL